MLKLFLLFNVVLMSVVQAREYKVVYNCSARDAGYIQSRMWLIGKTMDMVKEQGDVSKVILTLHGGCVAMVSKDYDMLVADEDVAKIKKAQEYLKSLSKRKNVKIIVCAMSLRANRIEEEDVLPFIDVSKNSFLDTIKYQNDGYALMTFK